MFVPDGFRTNAYRVLRLSGNATLSEIHKAAASMRRASTLGLAGTNEADIPLLGEVPRTEADIRTAVGRLANPTQRLSDRLLWFHQPPQPENAGMAPLATKFIPDPLDSIARCHDEALHGLFCAFEAGLDDSGAAVFVQALRAWHDIVSDDGYWALASAFEERGGFEPPALPSEVSALRGDVVRLAAEPLILAGRDAIARNDTPAIRLIMGALEQLVNTGPWAQAAQEDIAFPAIERFRALCHAIREECGSRIVREQNAVEHNRGVCDVALGRFRGEVEPALDGVIQLLTPTHEAAQQSREEAALCLSGIATHYTWADDFIASEELHKKALKLAQDTLGAIRIEHGLTQVRESARKQRIFGKLKPISSAPSLGTINGFGSTLYGSSDYDPETQSYATTRYFVALFVPILPVGRYRVIDMGGNQYRFLGKLPIRSVDRWHIGIAAVAIVAIVLSSVISSSQNSGSSNVPSTSSSYGPNSYSPRAPSTSSERPTDPIRVTTEPQSKKQRTYDPRKAQLSILNGQIEAGRSRMSMVESTLQPVIDELNTLNARLKPIASELKSLKRQHDAGLQIDIDDYNEKVNTHNVLLNRHKALIAANSSGFQLYDELAEKDKVLVAQYNALLKRQP
ncbi:MAG: hypothetical protein KKH04_09810 [Proteobacteria bacterium]|nr:hypothetical protein [Pseudomonadota bacterium]